MGPHTFILHSPYWSIDLGITRHNQVSLDGYYLYSALHHLITLKEIYIKEPRPLL